MKQYENQDLERKNKMDEYLNLINDYNQLKALINSGDIDATKNFIALIQAKYFVDVIIHNAENKRKPTSFNENVRNCLAFLENLIYKKSIELGIDISEIL